MTDVHTPGSVRRVPNKPKTPITGFRIPPALKEKVAARAAAEGRTLTDVVIEALERYARKKPPAGTCAECGAPDARFCNGDAKHYCDQHYPEAFR